MNSEHLSVIIGLVHFVFFVFLPLCAGAGVGVGAGFGFGVASVFMLAASAFDV